MSLGVLAEVYIRSVFLCNVNPLSPNVIDRLLACLTGHCNTLDTHGAVQWLSQAFSVPRAKAPMGVQGSSPRKFSGLRCFEVHFGASRGASFSAPSSCL